VLLAHHRQKGLATNVLDKEGRTALHLAAGAGHYQCVQVILLAGKSAAASRDDSGATPLHLAIRGGHTRVVEIWAASRADMEVGDNEGMSPLHIACEEGQPAAAQAILLVADHLGRQKGGEEQVTPLHVAAGQGKLECVPPSCSFCGLLCCYT
jgi:ankyrin repeat protein